MNNSIEQLIAQLVSFAPKVLSVLVVIIAGILISKVLQRSFKRILEKIKIDRFDERLNEIELIQNSGMKIKLSLILSKLIQYFTLLFFMIMAADILGMPAISNLVTGLFNFIPKLVVGFIILIFGILLSNLIKIIVETTLVSLGIPSAKILASFIFYFIIINVVIVAISQAEIETGFLQQNLSIIIAGGVLAFAIGYGLASRDVMSNFLSSFYSGSKLSIGDIVTIDGEKGEVIEISRTSLTILSDGTQVVFPLKILLQQKFKIHSKEIIYNN